MLNTRFLISAVCLMLCLPVPAIRADESGELKQLLTDLKSGESVKKRKAVKQIAEMGTSAKSAAPTLIVVLERERDVLVRRGAAETLGNIAGDPKTTIAALSKALKDSDKDVRRQAAEILGKLGAAARPASAALQETAAKDLDASVKAAAEKALKAIGH